MKIKYFNIDKLHVGCLGKMTYYGNDRAIEWNRNVICPYVVFSEKLSDSLDNCHECKDIFSNETYYLFNEVSKRDSTLEIVHGNYIIGKSLPLKIVCGSDKEEISFTELKSIICNFNITDALIKNRDDIYLPLLKKCLDDIDLMEEGKVKEYYMDNILSLINSYSIIIDSNCDKKKFDIFVEEVNRIRHVLDKEKEIAVKKTRKLR